MAQILFALVTLGLGLSIACAPLPVLLDRFIPDDAFYFFKPALNLATTGFSSLDGIHPTNGYQPLWFALSVLVFWVFPQGGELPLRILLVTQALLFCGGTLVLLRALQRSFGLLVAGAAMVVWLVVVHRLAVNGLETALVMLMLALALRAWVGWFTADAGAPTAGKCFWFGLCCALLFLTRTDMAFAVGGFSVALWLRLRRHGSGWRPLAAFAVPLVVIGGAYLTLNLLTTGHVMPVSGAAKQYHSAMARDAAVAERGSYFAVLWQNLTWPLSSPGHRYVVVGLIGPWLLAIASLFRPRNPVLALMRCLWPLHLGCLVSFVFYGVVFYGGFTQTAWYYVPHALAATLTVAACGALVSRAGGREAGALLALVLSALVLNWPPWHADLVWSCSGAVAVAWALRAYVVPRIPSGVRAVLALLVLAATVTGLVAYPDLDLSHQWLALGMGVLLAQSLGLFALPAFRGGGLALCPVVAGAVAIAWINLRPELVRPPSHWNYNLYRGALWAKDNLPEDATVWSGSTGILAYFSERTCVNTDGLANSFDFLDNVLRQGRLHEFQLRFDYAIDAFATDAVTGWHEIFPAGAWVELPAELRAAAFADGTLTRGLGVFQMRSQPAEPDAWRSALGNRFTAVADDIENGDFQTGDLRGWSAEGDAFAQQPRRGKPGDLADWLIDTANAANSGKGVLTSRPFVLRRDQIMFRVAGGATLATRVELWVDGKRVRRAAGPGTDQLTPRFWGVAMWRGRVAWLRVVDEADATLPLGYLRVDDFRQVDR